MDAEPKAKPQKLKIVVSPADALYLRILGDTPEEAVRELIARACDGMARPGAWERDWLESAFHDVEGRLDVALERGDLEVNQWGQFVPPKEAR